MDGSSEDADERDETLPAMLFREFIRDKITPGLANQILRQAADAIAGGTRGVEISAEDEPPMCSVTEDAFTFRCHGWEAQSLPTSQARKIIEQELDELT